MQNQFPIPQLLLPARIADLRESLSILDVISYDVPITVREGIYEAECLMCPKRTNTQDLCISPKTGVFRCFNCGSGGDIFSYIMLRHRLHFIGAVEYLDNRDWKTKKIAEEKDNG